MKTQINEKKYIEVNGMEQGIFLQSQNIENPVLLFLHGGPGSPEIAFTQEHPTGLDKLFTVCWWEQRGSGMSYNRDIPQETMTVEQMIADTIVVTNYLCKRFEKEKIYIMGHSWGSFLGVLTVQKVPGLYHAYIGIGQIARQEESERLAYTYMVDKFEAAGNRSMVRKLERFAIDRDTVVDIKYLGIRNRGIMKLGIGIMHRYTTMMDVIKIVLRFKGYTLKEKINFPRGNRFSLKCLWDTIMNSDFEEQVPRLEVPVYLLHGKMDYQVSYIIAKEYAQTLKAPIKGFYTFEHSAHSPIFEEPEKVCHILYTDVLQGRADLSDEIESI